MFHLNYLQNNPFVYFNFIMFVVLEQFYDVCSLGQFNLESAVTMAPAFGISILFRSLGTTFTLGQSSVWNLHENFHLDNSPFRSLPT